MVDPNAGHFPLSRKIVVGTGVLILAIWAAAIAALIEIHLDRSDLLQHRGQALADALALHTRETVERIDSGLIWLTASAKSVTELGVRGDLPGFDLKDETAIAGYAITDAKGRVIRAGGSETVDTDFAERAVFFAPRREPGGGLFISPAITDQKTRRTTIGFSRRIEQPDREFAGVATIFVEPRQLLSLPMETDPGPESVYLIISRDGTVRARRGLNGVISSGGTVADNHSFPGRLATGAPSGSVEARALFDGVVRIYSYRSLPEYRLVAIVGLPTGGAFQWSGGDYAVAGTALAATLLSGWAGMTLAGAVRRREAAIDTAAKEIADATSTAAANAQATRVAQRARIEAEAQRAETENRINDLSVLLAGFGQEARTRLNAILGFAQHLAQGEGGAPAPQQRESIAHIDASTQAILRRVGDLGDIALIERGLLSLTIMPIDVAALIAVTVAQLAPVGAERGVTISAAPIPANRSSLQTDGARLQQMLSNLGQFALRRGYAGTVLTLDVGWTGERIRFIWRTETPSSVAGKSARLPNNGTAEKDVGLGLTHRLAELMGGELGIDSWRGNTSSIWLDLPEHLAATSSPPAAELELHEVEAYVGNLPPFSVLYVEDDATNLRLLRATLGRLPNCRFFEAATAREGLRLAQSVRPDLIILDINLPDADGYAVLERLRAQPTGGGRAIFALTAAGGPDEARRGRAAGFDEYLTKPLMVRALLEAIAAHLQPGKPRNVAAI